jgi:hypothetical protein
MTTVNWERWARATGIGFVVLFVVAFIVFGDQPKVGASADKIVSFYDGDRSRVLTATVIFGVATLFLLWFAGAVANALREAGEGRLAATTIASAATLAGIFFMLMAVGAGLAYSVAGAGETGVVRALSDILWAFNVLASFPAAAFIAAATAGLWRTRLVPDWFGWAGLVAALIVLLGGTAWASDGFWAPDGALTLITMIVALAWILAASAILFMQAPVAGRAPERAPATPMP